MIFYHFCNINRTQNHFKCGVFLALDLNHPTWWQQCSCFYRMGWKSRILAVKCLIFVFLDVQCVGKVLITILYFKNKCKKGKKNNNNKKQTKPPLEILSCNHMYIWIHMYAVSVNPSPSKSSHLCQYIWENWATGDGKRRLLNKVSMSFIK